MWKTKEKGIWLFVFGLVVTPMIFFAFSRINSKKNVPKTTSTNLSMDQWVEERMKNMTTNEKIAQFFMVAVHPNEGSSNTDKIARWVQEQKIGGLIYFQSDDVAVKKHIADMQSLSETPLLIGMDAEWGTSMRLFKSERFPYAYTMGASNDTAVSRRLAQQMAAECRSLGIHINFAPVADVNSNPKNPVIGFRSFGENTTIVCDHVKAMVLGFEQGGILSCIKHFPGHGDTDKDSHYELPTVTKSLEELKKTDFKPFEAGISAGCASVMVAHLNVPALDKSGTPSSLSKSVISDQLKSKMGFKGLVFSDALNMKGVSDKYGKTEVVVKAFEAGCDVLLYPESVEEAIAAIHNKVKDGTISMKEIDSRCRKILEAKYKYVVKPSKSYVFDKDDLAWSRQELYEKAITVLKNEGDFLPIKHLNRKIARVSIGVHSFPFRQSIDLFDNAVHHHYYSFEEALKRFPAVAKNYDVIIVGAHSNTVRSRNNYGFSPSFNDFLSSLPENTDNVLALFGNPLVLSSDKIDLSRLKSVVIGYENHALMQKTAAQLIYGAIPASGKLPITINQDWKAGFGKELDWGGRLKHSFPQELGIDPKKLKEIDDIAINGIEKKAFPGCQVLVAVEGKIIYRKCFGKHTYEGSDSVRHEDVYDIASISKIAGSTLGIMKLQSKGMFSLSNTIGHYLPELTSKYEPYASINLRDMLAHQAGLTAWIAFYKKTLVDGKPSSKIYSEVPREGYDIQVAQNLFIKNNYIDTIYRQIMTTALGPKKYEYSDLGYYFVKKIVEKQSGKAFQDFLLQELYQPLGLRHLRFHPRMFFPLKNIVPTEDDQAFRKQLIHGYVHDPGAAMLGGIGGHAGLFCNATDLASLMQVFLNKGRYGNTQVLNPEVVEEYTKAQFSGNRRGAGFDRPQANGGGTCHELASQQSFGHSGFTGTLVWADPKYQINYVFLSNRVCPSQDNWKIRDMNIRTEIQRVIYEAVAAVR